MIIILLKLFIAGSILLLEAKDEDLKLKWDLNDALNPKNINPIKEPTHPLINLVQNHL